MDQHLELGLVMRNSGSAAVVQSYALLSAPTPQDSFFYGAALTNLGRNEEAKLPLYIAAEAGITIALVDLIIVYTNLGEFQEADVMVNHVRTLDLTPFQRAAFLSAECGLLYARGDTLAALRNGKRQWLQLIALERLADRRIASPDESSDLSILEYFEARRFLRSIATCGMDIADVLCGLGQHKEALEYLEEAARTGRHIARWDQILQISRAQCQAYLGNVDVGQSLLDDCAKVSADDPVVHSYYLMTRAALDIARGHLREALRSAIEAKNLIETLSVHLFRTETTLRVVALHIRFGALDEARLGLAGLASFSLSCSDELLKKLRLATLHHALGDCALAATSLMAVAESLRAMHRLTEESHALLRLALVQHDMQQFQDATLTLDRAADVVAEIGDAAYLRLELNLIGVEGLERLHLIASTYARRVLQLADKSSAPTLDVVVSDKTVRISSFGRARVVFGTDNSALRHTKSMELIVYLLIRRSCTFDDAWDALFEGRARSYFGVAINNLKKHSNSLTVAYDKASARYTLEIASDAQVDFDYHRLQALLEQGDEASVRAALDLYTAPFLSQLEGEWVEQVRHDLEWSLVRSALRVVTALYDGCHYFECRSLAARLLRFSPFDPTITEVIVSSTLELDGLLVASGQQRLFERGFEREYGEPAPKPPPTAKR
jgi:tetratricopeptide (TPR) repeat protein